ncbi:ATP-grasp domain-containing protein [Ferrovibrio sp.]|uniref:ATP-grasp domain-containing protein n=1 Tax=Ferrovibrio sp. TaxID=1917215 RepID=UPI003D0D2AD5
MPEPITVLVSAIGGGGHGEQILKALRAAVPGSYRIIGGDISPLCPQFSMVDVPVLLPRASSPEYIDALLALCARYNVQAVFHGCEPDLQAMSRERQRFADIGVLLPINPASVIDICMDKVRTAEFLSRQGFKTPRYQVLGADSDLSAVDYFPVVVKPSRDSGGSQNTFIAQTPRELEILAEYVRSTANTFIIQEYVGDFRSEFTVGVLHDLDGNFLNSIAVHRALSGGLNVRMSVPNITGRKSLGEKLVISSGVSHGFVDKFPEITGPCEAIAKALGARGAINIQCRMTDEGLYIFEINPRFSGTTSLRALVGYNEPDLLLRHHLRDERLEPRFSYGKGWVIRTLSETLLDGTDVPNWQTLLSP